MLKERGRGKQEAIILHKFTNGVKKQKVFLNNYRYVGFKLF
jgi:hypothetical protein